MATNNMEKAEPKQDKKPTLIELCRIVDAISDAKERKEFFKAHPELEIYYSHANFTD